MYCIVKRCWKVLELSHYFCVKIFVTVTFIISIQQKSGKLWAWASCYWICRCYVFVLGPYPLQFKDVCIQNGHSVWLFVNGQTIFLKRILLTALFERAHSSQNALVSWLRTHKVRHQVKISACVNVHASIYILYIEAVLLNMALEQPQNLRWKFSLENTVCIYFCIF